MKRSQKIYLGFVAAVLLGYVGLETSGWAAGGRRGDPIDQKHLTPSQRGNTYFGGYAFYRRVGGK